MIPGVFEVAILASKPPPRDGAFEEDDTELDAERVPIVGAFEEDGTEWDVERIPRPIPESLCLSSGGSGNSSSPLLHFKACNASVLASRRGLVIGRENQFKMVPCLIVWCWTLRIQGGKSVICVAFVVIKIM